MRLDPVEGFEEDVKKSAKHLKKAEAMRRAARYERNEGLNILKNVISNYGETVENSPKFYINVPESCDVIEVLNYKKRLFDTKQFKKEYPVLAMDYEYEQNEQRISVKTLDVFPDFKEEENKQ